MNMKFSQRIGKRPIKTVLQIESIDDDLMNRLWNTIIEDFFDKFSPLSFNDEESEKGHICRLIWVEYFNYRIDEIPRYDHNRLVHSDGFIQLLRSQFFQRMEWFEIYDFIEFLALVDSTDYSVGFTKQCNIALKREVAGYRIVNECILQITSEEEIKAIEDAITNTDKWNSVNTHLKAAVDILADRKTPEYRNSIKESISAVESFCRILTNDDKATLGKALSEIEKTHKIHPALKTAFSSIYGYASDSGGIRHSLLEEDKKIEFEDAKFMLVSCSAFINYLKAKVK